MGRIGQAKQFAQLDERARALLPTDHREVALVPIEPGHEDHAGFVEAGWIGVPRL